MVRAAELAGMDPDELVTRLDETRKELFNLRFQLATGQLDNPARMGQVRRDVARILTVLREREIQEAEGLLEEVPVAPVPARPGRARRSARAAGTEIAEVEPAGAGEPTVAAEPGGDEAGEREEEA